MKKFITFVLVFLISFSGSLPCAFAAKKKVKIKVKKSAILEMGIERARTEAIARYEAEAAARRLVTLTGIVRDRSANNSPLGGVEIHVGMTLTATTGADGRYTLANIPVGNHSVSAMKAGYVNVMRQLTITEGGNSTMNFDLQQLSGNINGEVLLIEETRKSPIANATVSYDGPSRGSVQTDARGTFQIRSLPLGTYNLRVTQSVVGTSGNEMVTLQNAGRTVNVTLPLEDTEEEIEIEVEE